MDIYAAYQEVGSYRAAAEICGTTPKTVKRVVENARREGGPSRPHNYDTARDVVAERVERTKGRISAKRLLPIARAAGYKGSARNFRRLVATAKTNWRKDNHRGRRPGVWSPGDMLVIDWGAIEDLHVFCAVMAWSRWRFVAFADNERADTTMSFLACCFEAMGGVPKTVLTDRMGCLKGWVVANLVIPTPAYVRFATHYGFRPDFCEGGDPESKGLVENLVGYAKSDLMIPEELSVGDLALANEKAVTWRAEVNAVVHSEISAVPDERLAKERELLRPLPSLRASLGTLVTRKVDKLSCLRFGSARYSVPTSHIGRSVEVRAADGEVLVLFLGEIVARHALVAPGETSIVDDHYGGPRLAPQPRL
jgi:transposase